MLDSFTEMKTPDERCFTAKIFGFLFAFLTITLFSLSIFAGNLEKDFTLNNHFDDKIDINMGFNGPSDNWFPLKIDQKISKRYNHIDASFAPFKIVSRSNKNYPLGRFHQNINPSFNKRIYNTSKNYFAPNPIALNDEDLNNLPGAIASVFVFSNDTLSTGVAANSVNANIDLDPDTPIIDHTLVVVGKGTFVYHSSSETVTFEPQTGFFGSPSPINYVLIETGLGLKDTATITFTYLLPVVALNDSSKNNVPGVNAVLSIVSNDTLSDGGPATAAEVSVDLNLSLPDIQNELSVAGQGSWTYNNLSGQITFDPDTAYTVDPTQISYVLRELSTGLADTASVVVNYIISQPIAQTDSSINNIPQTTVTVLLLENDKLSDSSEAEKDKVVIDLEPGVGGDEQSLFVPTEGTYSYNATNGVLTFVPRIGFYGNPTPIEYSIRETLTGLSDTAKVVITNLLSPSLELVKVGSLIGTGYVNDSIVYSFTVINTGNIPVTGITINDAKLSPSPILVTPSGLAPGGIGVAEFRYRLSNSDILNRQVINSAIVNGLSINGIAVTDSSDNGDPAMSGNSNPTINNLTYIPIIDVELKSETAGDCQRAIGDTVTVKLIVSRKDSLIFLSDIVVKDSLTSGFQFISAVASEGTYDHLLNEWSGINLAGSNDSAVLEVKLKVLTNIGGLSCLTAWVSSQTFNDSDSNPGNKVESEDDITKSCVSIPINICPQKSESVELSSGSGYGSYQWYRNSILILSATNPTYVATQSGSYTVIVDGASCPGNSCCPIIVSELCPCPPVLCIPFTLRKIN